MQRAPRGLVSLGAKLAGCLQTCALGKGLGEAVLSPGAAYLL